MAIPTYDGFIGPLLRLLSDKPDGLRSTVAYELLAAAVGLSEAERQEMLPSGRQPVFHNRIGWANDRLKRHGLSESLSRGVWRLTERGHEFVRAHPGLERETVLPLAEVPETTDLAAGARISSPPPAPIAAHQSPEERIERALAELHESVAAELLGLIAASPPDFFERLVLDVLQAMGYGANRAAAIEPTGGTGDGGIDGIIALDRLGLEKVAVQAKRWKGNVGRPDVQAFYGALAGQRVRKGVFITTSTYTTDARRYAEQLSDTVVLIDGPMLATLMIEHGVGVSVARRVAFPRVDRDYFEQ